MNSSDNLWAGAKKTKMLGGALRCHYKTELGVLREKRLYEIVDCLEYNQEYQLHKTLENKNSPRAIKYKNGRMLIQEMNGKPLGNLFFKNNLLKILSRELVQVHMFTKKIKIPTLDTQSRILNYKIILQENDSLQPVTAQYCQWLSHNAHLYDNSQNAFSWGLVHGDFRGGNILYKDSEISGVLDWEFAHIGNQVEDIAWFLSPLWNKNQTTKSYEDSFIQDYLKYTTKLNHSATGGVCRNDVLNSAEFYFWKIFALLRFAAIATQQYKNIKISKNIEMYNTGWRVFEIEQILTQLRNNHFDPKNIYFKDLSAHLILPHSHKYSRACFPRVRTLIRAINDNFWLVLSRDKSLKCFFLDIFQAIVLNFKWRLFKKTVN